MVNCLRQGARKAPPKDVRFRDGQSQRRCECSRVGDAQPIDITVLNLSRCMARLLRMYEQQTMLSRSRRPTPELPGANRMAAARRWRPADVVALVVVVCYGAAALIVAAGLFVRLV